MFSDYIRRSFLGKVSISQNCSRITFQSSTVMKTSSVLCPIFCTIGTVPGHPACTSTRMFEVCSRTLSPTSFDRRIESLSAKKNLFSPRGTNFWPHVCYVNYRRRTYLSSDPHHMQHIAPSSYKNTPWSYIIKCIE